MKSGANASLLAIIFIAAIQGSPARAWVRNCGEQSEPSTRIAINDFCRDKKWTCVVDLTSKANCRIRPRWSGSALIDIREDLAHDCPSYGWKEFGDVHSFGPIDGSDSMLNVEVGPVKKKISPFDLGADLETESNLPKQTWAIGVDCPGPGFASLKDEIKRLNNDRRRFSIPKGKYRDALIVAAQQYGPSTWTESCYQSIEWVCRLDVDDFYDLTHPVSRVAVSKKDKPNP